MGSLFVAACIVATSVRQPLRLPSLTATIFVLQQSMTYPLESWRACAGRHEAIATALLVKRPCSGILVGSADCRESSLTCGWLPNRNPPYVLRVWTCNGVML